MAYLIGSLIGSLIWPIVAAAIAWFMSSKKERKTRILITIVSFVAVLIIFNGVKYISSNTSEPEPQNNTSLESSQQETEETTETEKVYAKMGPLTIDITNLGYTRVKSKDDLFLPDFTEEEKESVWENATSIQSSETKIKVWQDDACYYIFTLAKVNNAKDVFNSLDDFIDELNQEEGDNLSGSHIDIDGVHAYKIFEKNAGDTEWNMSETVFFNKENLYFINVQPLYTGEDIDLEKETALILSHAAIKK